MSPIVSQIPETMKDGILPPSRILVPLEQMLSSNIQFVKSGQFLRMETDEASSVLCLLNGWLSLSKCLPDGEIQIVDCALPGEIIETGAAVGSVSPVSIQALTDVSVAVFPFAVWEDMKRQRPDLSQISSDTRAVARARTAGRMLRLGRGRAKMRLAYALLELKVRLEAIGQSSQGMFEIPMNQRILGDFIGLSSVHVCRTLGQLVDMRIIRVRGQMSIEVLNLDLLEEMAGIDQDTLRCEILMEPDQVTPTPAHLAFA